jgi:hypothetical protein
MAIFKILHGDASRISMDVTPFHEGYCYVTHDGFMYIDMNVGTADIPNNQRIKLNANQAESLIGYNIATILNSSNIEIPTSKVVLDALNEKSQVQVITSETSEILSTLKIHKISQEEYDQSLADGTLEDNAIYLTPDEEIDLSGYATIDQLNEKANAEHSHDNVYYTETEINDLLLNKSDTSHNHDDKYDTKGSANEALTSAKSYTDTSVNEVKSYSDTNLSAAKTYTDNAVTQKSQVQIITWEADD